MLKVSNLTKKYDDLKVLDNLSFNIERANKIALVGYNGTGKSTLLKILAGFVKPHKHTKITYQKNVEVAFLPQETNEYDDRFVIDFIAKYTKSDEADSEFLRKIDVMFAGFGLDSMVKNQKIEMLSSGQKTKVFLVAILLKKPDLLLLDEPTNNLDLPALIWLENYLQKYKSGFIVVSHDKKFLDNVANKIFEIDWATKELKVSAGKYSDYLINQEKNLKRQTLQHTLQRHEIFRLHNLARNKKEAAAKGAKWVGTDNNKIQRGNNRNRAGKSLRDAAVVYGRIDRMEKIEKPNHRKKLNVNINSIETELDKKIIVKDLVCGYKDGGPEFKIGPLNFEIDFTEHFVLLGLNGSGKTTFLKTLTGEIQPLEGEIKIGEGLRTGNLMQEHENLPPHSTPLEFLLDRDYHEQSYLQNQLLKFGFAEDQLKTEIQYLSPGNRARLLLALFAIEEVNVLILDEPTNHLDLEASTALESAMKKFEGTIILATHDRHLVEKLELENLNLLENGKMHKISDFSKHVEAMQARAKKLLHMLK